MMKPILAEAIAAVVLTAKKVAGSNAASTRMAFVGGLAVTRLTKHRQTDDIDVFFTGGLEGRKLRTELSRAHSAFCPDFEAIIGLTYKSPTLGQIVKVDILDMAALRFEPRTLPLSEVTLDNLPWPNRDELISVKALSASERFYVEKVRKDVMDIEALLTIQPGPLLFPGSTMAEANKAMVKEFVPQLAKLVGGGVARETRAVLIWRASRSDMEDLTLCMSIKGIACPIDLARCLDGEGKKIPDPGSGLTPSVGQSVSVA